MNGLRVIALASIALASANAPYQCSRKTPPELRLEDDAAEVLHDLAESFKASGDVKAQRETLRYLVKRYPSSRWAKMARQDLEAAGEPVLAPQRP